MCKYIVVSCYVECCTHFLCQCRFNTE
uniref:Uncharacterized protein n=1 Tax=Anguilla anguilla TaxID=7936 RepID=A0A0E9WUI5_ANGAN